MEDETAVAFLGYASMLTQDDPAYLDCYLEQFKEMIERDRSQRDCLVHAR